MINPLSNGVTLSIQCYRNEIYNYNFTDKQIKELNDIVDKIEKNNKIYKYHKMIKPLKNYEQKFVECGGDLKQLNDKISEIYKPLNESFKLDKLKYLKTK